MTKKNTKKKIIIGLTGKMASGKGTVVKYLIKKHKVDTYKFSKILRDILDRLYLEKSRKNIQNTSTFLRKNFGEDCLARAITEDVKKSKNKLIIVDGIRRLVDIKYLIKEKNIKFYLIAIEIDPKIAYQRLIKRNENKGDNKKTYQQFLADQRKESDREIPKVIKKADFIIDNNGTLKDFKKQISKLSDKYLLTS